MTLYVFFWIYWLFISLDNYTGYFISCDLMFQWIIIIPSVLFLYFQSWFTYFSSFIPLEFNSWLTIYLKTMHWKFHQYCTPSVDRLRGGRWPLPTPTCPPISWAAPFYLLPAVFWWFQCTGPIYRSSYLFSSI